ncbi:histidine kinase, partial [Streptomyces sp. SID10362]|nr:histidine kinase [Streptomyces sp. SID10362]
GAPGGSRDGSSPGDEHGGLAPLPRRVPQTSLAAELRDEDPGVRRDGAEGASGDDYADFTAERAASSLAGFQRGTLRAQTDDDTDATDTDADTGTGTGTGTDGPVPSAASASAASTPSTPPADRRPPTKDTR